MSQTPCFALILWLERGSFQYVQKYQHKLQVDQNNQTVIMVLMYKMCWISCRYQIVDEISQGPGHSCRQERKA